MWYDKLHNYKQYVGNLSLSYKTDVWDELFG